MQSGPVLRDGHEVDCVPNLMARVKAIFKFISILHEQIRSFQEAKIKLLNSWHQGDDLGETVGNTWKFFNVFNDSVFFFSQMAHIKKIGLRYKKTVKT